MVISDEKRKERGTQDVRLIDLLKKKKKNQRSNKSQVENREVWRKLARTVTIFDTRLLKEKKNEEFTDLIQSRK